MIADYLARMYSGSDLKILSELGLALDTGGNCG